MSHPHTATTVATPAPLDFSEKAIAAVSPDVFNVLFLALGGVALYLFVIRPLLVKDGITTLQSAETYAGKLWSAVVSFVTSKWTYVLGIGAGLIAFAYISQHLIVATVTSGLLIILVDYLLNSKPDTKTVIGVVEEAAKTAVQEGVTFAGTQAKAAGLSAAEALQGVEAMVDAKIRAAETKIGSQIFAVESKIVATDAQKMAAFVAKAVPAVAAPAATVIVPAAAIAPVNSTDVASAVAPSTTA